MNNGFFALLFDGSFFLEGAVPATAEFGVYILPLVLLSYIVGSLASYTALVLATQLTNPDLQVNKGILHLGGAAALGAGIWSMHFIGMLAYKMDMHVEYDPLITFLSLLVAIGVAYGALHFFRRDTLNVFTVLFGAVLLGFGICAMHYVGMAAMVMDGDIRYQPVFFWLSVVIAIVASAAALLIVFVLVRHRSRFRQLYKCIASLVMGAAICGMHYTGMTATVFIPWADCRYDPDQSFIVLALAIAIVNFAVLVITLPLGAKLYQSATKRTWLEYIPVYLAVIFGVGISLASGKVVYDAQRQEIEKVFLKDAHLLEKRALFQLSETIHLNGVRVLEDGHLLKQLARALSDEKIEVISQEVFDAEDPSLTFYEMRELHTSDYIWQVVFVAKSEAYVRDKVPELSAVLGGILVTLLISGYLLFGLRSRSVDQEVQQKTRETAEHFAVFIESNPKLIIFGFSLIFQKIVRVNEQQEELRQVLNVQ